MKSRWFLCGLFIAGFVVMCGCTSTTTAPVGALVTPVPQATLGASNDTFSLQVASISSEQALPETYTCTGFGESPEIRWNGVPVGTQSLILIVDDPDAPNGTFTHWLVYNIPPGSEGLTKAQTGAKVLANGAQQGDSSAGSRGYYPPCPPIGTEHRYMFRLYALDTIISMPTTDREGIDVAMSGHVIDKVETGTTFKR